MSDHDPDAWKLVDEGWGRRAAEFSTLSEPGNVREYARIVHNNALLRKLLLEHCLIRMAGQTQHDAKFIEAVGHSTIVLAELAAPCCQHLA